MISHAYTLNLARQYLEVTTRRPDEPAWTPLPLFHFNAWACTVVASAMLGSSATVARRFSVSGFGLTSSAPEHGWRHCLARWCRCWRAPTIRRKCPGVADSFASHKAARSHRTSRPCGGNDSGSNSRK